MSQACKLTRYDVSLKSVRTTKVAPAACVLEKFVLSLLGKWTEVTRVSSAIPTTNMGEDCFLLPCYGSHSLVSPQPGTPVHSYSPLVPPPVSTVMMPPARDCLSFYAPLKLVRPLQHQTPHTAHLTLRKSHRLANTTSNYKCDTQKGWG